MHRLNIKEVMTKNVLSMSTLLIQLKSPDSELSKTSNELKIGSYGSYEPKCTSNVDTVDTNEKTHRLD